MNILAYIHQNWDKTIRVNIEDSDSLIGLPYPYTVPCCEGRFQEMYYWDTYFTNAGLLKEGLVEQAKHNINNMCFLIHKYGFMPNGNRTFYLSRSQPPFLSQMIREVFDRTKDISWLSQCYEALEKEYTFWQTQRNTPSGLNRYYGLFSEEWADTICDELCDRFQIPAPSSKEARHIYSKSMLSFAESGWDCNSRMGMEVYRYNWVDLNALLFGMEQNMACFSHLLQNGQSQYWQQQSAVRATKMTDLMWDDQLGAFCDYNFETKEKTTLVSAAMFYPLFTGVCTPQQAAKTVQLLPRLEFPYGIACCEKKDRLYNLQWDYPNGWACLHHIVIHGLLRYGYREDALRIAKKYTQLAENVFEKTGHLWEKYNVLTGEVSVSKEYETPAMMGWSAGVYLDCQSLLSSSI